MTTLRQTPLLRAVCTIAPIDVDTLDVRIGVARSDVTVRATPLR